MKRVSSVAVLLFICCVLVARGQTPLAESKDSIVMPISQFQRIPLEGSVKGGSGQPVTSQPTITITQAVVTENKANQATSAISPSTPQTGPSSEGVVMAKTEQVLANTPTNTPIQEGKNTQGTKQKKIKPPNPKKQNVTDDSQVSRNRGYEQKLNKTGNPANATQPKPSIIQAFKAMFKRINTTNNNQTNTNQTNQAFTVARQNTANMHRGNHHIPQQRQQRPIDTQVIFNNKTSQQHRQQTLTAQTAPMPTVMPTPVVPPQTIFGSVPIQQLTNEVKQPVMSQPLINNQPSQPIMSPALQPNIQQQPNIQYQPVYYPNPYSGPFYPPSYNPQTSDRQPQMRTFSFLNWMFLIFLIVFLFGLIGWIIYECLRERTLQKRLQNHVPSQNTIGTEPEIVVAQKQPNRIEEKQDLDLSGEKDGRNEIQSESRLRQRMQPQKDLI